MQNKTGPVKHISYALILGLGFHPGLAWSQVLLFEQYTIKDGLPSNWVTTIYQDSHGYLWVGGDGGLAIYDGVTFTGYGKEDGLPVPHVWSIIESKKKPDTYYIGTHGGGLTTLHNGVFSSQQIGENIFHNVIGHLLEDHEGTLWCGTNQGLFTVKNDSAAFFDTPGRDNEWAAFIVQTSDSLIWISHDRQLYRYTPWTNKLEDLNHIFPDSVWYLSLREDDQGVIWICTDAGDIHKVINDRVVATRKIPGSSPREILDDREGNLWLTTSGGPVKLSKATFPDGEIARYSEITGMLHEDVSPGFVDRENNLWFGTPRAGLYKLQDRHIVVFPFEGLNPDQPNSLVVDENGHLLASAKEGVWEVWEETGGSWNTHLHDRESLQIDEGVHSMALDREGRIWMAVDEGKLQRYRRNSQGDTATAFQLEVRLQPGVDLHDGGRFGRFMIDRNNQIWYGRTAFNGLSQYDLDEMRLKKVYTTEDGLTAGTISAILQDQDGFMWFGEFRGGIAVFRPQGDIYVPDRTYSVEDGLGGEQIRSIVQRRNGEIWIGHRYDGLTIYKDGHFTNLTAKDGLMNNAVWSLAEDEQGRVWLGTSAGIQHTSAEDDRTFISDRMLIRPTTRVLGQIPNQPMMFMMNEADLTLYRLPGDFARQPPTPVEIKALRVNGKEMELASELAFDYGENIFEIEYIGISLKDEHLLRFHYSLTNSKIEWTGTTNQRAVQFTSLRPDDYRFRVRAVNAEGVESPAPADLRFTVLPPVWQRWWFLTLGFIIIAATLYGVHQVSMQKALAVERIRARISTDLHDDIGAGLTHIGLLSEITLRKVGVSDGHGSDANRGNGAFEELTGCVERVGSIARELSESMSDVVWSINPNHDSVEALHHRLNAFAHEACQAQGMELDMVVSERIAQFKLNPEIRRNLLLIAKEALHNAAKYSGSPFIKIRLDMQGDDLTLEVTDGGRGFDLANAPEGNGLSNMRSRAEKVGGTCAIVSGVNQGTRVMAVVPHEKS